MGGEVGRGWSQRVSATLAQSGVRSNNIKNPTCFPSGRERETYTMCRLETVANRLHVYKVTGAQRLRYPPPPSPLSPRPYCTLATLHPTTDSSAEIDSLDPSCQRTIATEFCVFSPSQPDMQEGVLRVSSNISTMSNRSYPKSTHNQAFA